MDLSKPALEWIVSTFDLLVRVLTFSAALSGLVYFMSSRQLQKINKRGAADLKQQTESRQLALKKDIADAQVEIGSLKNENLRLGIQFEAEQKARMALQGKMAPRELTKAQRSRMVEMLRPFAGQQIDFRYLTEFETAHYAKQILSALQEAGWSVSVTEFNKIQPFYGIVCGGWDLNEPSLVALKAALAVADPDAEAKYGGAGSSSATGGQEKILDRLWLTIGLKRPNLK